MVKFNLQNMPISRRSKAYHGKTLRETDALLEPIRLKLQHLNVNHPNLSPCKKDLRKATNVKALVETLGICDRAVPELTRQSCISCCSGLEITSQRLQIPVPIIVSLILEVNFSDPQLGNEIFSTILHCLIAAVCRKAMYPQQVTASPAHHSRG